MTMHFNACNQGGKFRENIFQSFCVWVLVGNAILCSQAQGLRSQFSGENIDTPEGEMKSRKTYMFTTP